MAVIAEDELLDCAEDAISLMEQFELQYEELGVKGKWANRNLRLSIHLTTTRMPRGNTDMEAKDAWLLIAGAFLGFIGSLLATFAAPPVGSAVGKLKSGFIERNKARALASYAVVRNLKSGKRDKYLHLLTSWGFALTFLLMFALCAIFYITVHDWPHKLASGLLVLITAWAAMNRMTHAVITLGRLENFEDYRAALMRRWPDIKLPDPE